MNTCKAPVSVTHDAHGAVNNKKQLNRKSSNEKMSFIQMQQKNTQTNIIHRHPYPI